MFTAVASLAAAAASPAAQPHARIAVSAPAVQTMVVGQGGRVLSSARTVTAANTTVHMSARNCAVAGGTPLAALLALRREGGPGFALRDYGHCGASASNSAELFVYSLGGQSNSGQNGWEYKVDGVSGSTGAGDPSGPTGNGRRLSSGEQVLWFWCEASSGGCQRTLQLSASSVSHGQALSVSVNGCDNEGQCAPVAYATVKVGLNFATTGSAGRATLTAPSRPGRYQVTATRHGLVPSFPLTIAVR
jgi:hypothetical protein